MSYGYGFVCLFEIQSQLDSKPSAKRLRLLTRSIGCTQAREVLGSGCFTMFAKIFKYSTGDRLPREKVCSGTGHEEPDRKLIKVGLPLTDDSKARIKVLRQVLGS